ncbi:MAG: transcriptional repressor LexA [Chlamydiia bacterium]|nr:transcriptional repressor LexA [Chlamydiia bacterium]
MKTLTKRQKEILDFISDSIGSKGYSPTYREIQSEFDFSSVGSVVGHIKALADKGFLEIDPKKRRSIVPKELETPKAVHESHDVELPFVGMIQASFPIEMYSETKTMKVPSPFVRDPSGTYILQVQGDSLNNELMKDGDLILVEARQVAEPGELIIGTTVYNETYISRYYPEGDYIRLEGSHPDDAPAVLPSDEFTLIGAVTGLLRSYF